MFWFVSGLLVLGGLLYLLAPMLRGSFEEFSRADELEDYQSEIRRIDKALEKTDDPELAAQKLEFQRKMIALSQSGASVHSPPPTLLVNSLFLLVTFGALGLYSLLGRPDLTSKAALEKPTLAAPQALAQSAEPQHENDTSLDELVERLGARLATDQAADPNGWMLYARSLMNLGRYPEAFSAYEKVLELSGNNSDVASEYQRAQDFAAQRQSGTPSPARGPSAAEMEAAAAMSDEDRSAMIEGMVSGLASRLRESPDDPEGWTRLLRARKVLGQEAEAQDDIKIIRSTFADQPEIIDQILLQTGWKN